MCQSRSCKEVSLLGYTCICLFCLCGSGAAKTEVLFSTVESSFQQGQTLHHSQYRKAALSVTGKLQHHHHPRPPESGSLPAPYMTSSNLAKGNYSTSKHLPPLFHCPKISNKAHHLLEFTSTRETNFSRLEGLSKAVSDLFTTASSQLECGRY